MYLKKKAGLALALAAIFTVGGSGLALAADNVTITPSNPDGTGAEIVNTSAGDYIAVGGDQVTAKELAVSVTANKTATANQGQLVAENKTDDATQLTATLDTGSIVEVLGKGKTLAVNGKGEAVDLIVTGGGTLKLAGDGGSLKNAAGDATLALKSGAGASITSGYAINKIEASSTTVITVGDNTNAGSLAVDVANLAAGSTVFVDPAWNADTPYLNGVATFADIAAGTTPSTISAALVAGTNSRFSIGTNNDNMLLDILKTINTRWAAEGSVAAKPHWDGPTGFNAAFGIFKPFEITQASGLIVADPTINNAAFTTNEPEVSKAGNVFFANDSLAVFDVGNGAVLSSVGDTANLVVKVGGVWDSANDEVDPFSTGGVLGEATLYLANANVGEHTLITEMTDFQINDNGTDLVLGSIGTKDLNATNAGNHWNGDFALTSSKLLTVTRVYVDTVAVDSGQLKAVVSYNEDALGTYYPKLSSGLAGMVGDLYSDDKNDTHYDNSKGNTYRESNAPAGAPGIAFVSRATDDRFMPDYTEAAAVIEGAAQIAVAAGVPAVTNNVITRISSLIVDHNNLLNETQPAYGNEPGKLGIWVNPFYATSDVDGMDAGRFESGYEMNYGGAAFGLDYNVNEAFRLGLAMNVGGGDTESNGDFNKTEADFDFFGVSLYGSYTNGAFGLTGDVGFTGVDSEIDQNVPGSMLMSNLESNVDSDAFTVGLTGQYRFAASDNFNITPHLGLRYTKISVDDANVDLVSGGRVFDVTTEDQNLFQIPVGVEFSSNIVTDGGWTVTPSADLGVLFTAGDTDVESRARIVGTSFTGRTSADVNDSAAFQGRLGVKAAADNGLSLGLDYGILAGANQTDHQFSGMLRFEF